MLLHKNVIRLVAVVGLAAALPLSGAGRAGERRLAVMLDHKTDPTLPSILLKRRIGMLIAKLNYLKQMRGYAISELVDSINHAIHTHEQAVQVLRFIVSENPDGPAELAPLKLQYNALMRELEQCISIAEAYKAFTGVRRFCDNCASKPRGDNPFESISRCDSCCTIFMENKLAAASLELQFHALGAIDPTFWTSEQQLACACNPSIMTKRVRVIKENLKTIKSRIQVLVSGYYEEFFDIVTLTMRFLESEVVVLCGDFMEEDIGLLLFIPVESRC